MYLHRVYPPPLKTWPRVLGTHGTENSGPVLVAIGGIHGNEPAGPCAIHNILDCLRQGIPFKGKFVGLGGNLEAMKRGQRFIDADLNRIWCPDVQSKAAVLGAERNEYQALRKQLEKFVDQAEGPVTLVDLHSSSADGPPFMLTGPQNEPNEDLFPIPRISGLIEKLSGILIHYAIKRGHRGMVFEGGQHRASATLDHLTTCLWLLLIEMGCVDAGDIPDLEEAVSRLNRISGDLPSQLDVMYRHAIQPGDDFKMEPGYRNFDHVFRGEVLARDCNGEIIAPVDGRILLPLYQGQGNDGFFIGMEPDLHD